MGLFFEKRAPVILSLTIAICFYLLSNKTLCDVPNLKEMLSAIINISAVIIGFLLTSVSILIALPGKRVIKRIQANNSMGIFTSYFASPVALGFLLIVLCTVFLPMEKMTGKWSHAWLTFLVFICSYFVLSSFRIATLLLGVLKKIEGETENSNPVSKMPEYKPSPDNFFKDKK